MALFECALVIYRVAHNFLQHFRMILHSLFFIFGMLHARRRVSIANENGENHGG